MAAGCYGQLESFELIKQAADFPDPQQIIDRVSWMQKLGDDHREAILGSIEQGGSGGVVKILRFLLSFIPAEIAQDEGISTVVRSSLSRAACKNHSGAVALLLNFLIDHPSGLETVSDLVSDLLLDTASSNAIKTTKLLVDSFGANVNILDKPQNMSPLHKAVTAGHLEMIELLVRDHHADIHRAGGKFANGPTPLWYAVHSQLEQATRLLLTLSGPVESIDRAITEGTTRVFISADTSYRAPVRLLAKMDPNWDDEESTERFLCLEFPNGPPGGVQIRRVDAELKDNRELRQREERGCVMV